MSEYTFHTLNDRDLEILLADLLNSRERKLSDRITFHHFPEGRDKGIDLLYSSPVKDYQIVVQVKHYLKTGVAGLLRSLNEKNKSGVSEVDKVRILKPSRYIFATSLALTVQNKEAIRDIFQPYIRSLEDIIGHEDINTLLREFPEIELQHYKLWFSSTAVFQRIIHNSTIGRSEFESAAIQKRIRLYVPCAAHMRAEQMLKQNKCLIITGEPGTGKTTLAEMLVAKYLGQGFKLSYIYEHINEAESLLQNNDEGQVFYFDDFLGHTALEIEHAQHGEKSLLHFVQRIKSANNKLFVLTTRTPILNTALEKSERFRRANLNGISIPLSSYTEQEKYHIFCNHLYENEVPSDHIHSLGTATNIRSLSEHPNFFPRLAEFVTLREQWSNCPPVKYYQFILQQLNNPSQIWRHAYEQQIGICERWLINTLFSIGHQASPEVLEAAYTARIEYEVRENNIPRPENAWKRSVHRLMDGFICHSFAYQRLQVIAFLNPSIVDFLKNHLTDLPEEQVSIMNAAIYTEQLLRRFRPNSKALLNPPLGSYMLSKLKNETWLFNPDKYYTSEEWGVPEPHALIEQCYVLLMYYQNKGGIEGVEGLLDQIKWPDLLWPYHQQPIEFLKKAQTYLALKRKLTPHLPVIARQLVVTSIEMADLHEIKSLLEVYEIPVDRFSQGLGNAELLQEKIDSFMQEDIAETLLYLKNNITLTEEAHKAQNELEQNYRTAYSDFCIVGLPDLSEFNDYLWDQIVYVNLRQEEMLEADRIAYETELVRRLADDEDWDRIVSEMNENEKAKEIARLIGAKYDFENLVAFHILKINYRIKSPPKYPNGSDLYEYDLPF